MKIIILAGMPATGKSTTAKKLQEHFGFPIIEKDKIKEVLFDTIGFKSYAEKRQLDVAANDVLIEILQSLAAAGTSVIIDNNFDASTAEKLNILIEQNSWECCTIFFNADTQILYERYYERDSKGLRHLGHAMHTHYPLNDGETIEFEMTYEEFNQRFLDRGMADVKWSGRRLNVDSTCPEKIDIKRIVRFIDGNKS